jgi:hypothetical protein
MEFVRILGFRVRVTQQSIKRHQIRNQSPRRTTLRNTDEIRLHEAQFSRGFGKGCALITQHVHVKQR